MANDHFRYDLMVQDALRGVVRRVLDEVLRNGLPGEHHFFISFNTKAPGVKLSARLRQQYPKEMTIVMQHQFWELSVNDLQFEVGLSFGGIPEKLTVPFAAVTEFFDPSVQFGMKIEVMQDEAEVATLPAPTLPSAETEFKGAAGKAELRREARGAGSEPDLAPASQQDASEGGAAEEPGFSEPAKVVSLDSFRKKS